MDGYGLAINTAVSSTPVVGELYVTTTKARKTRLKTFPFLTTLWGRNTRSVVPLDHNGDLMSPL